MQKITPINVVSGTASYALPADFRKMISLTKLRANKPGNVLITDSGLMPLSTTVQERVMVQGAQIVIYPTPAYTMTRDLRYAAGYVLSGAAGAEVYADLTDDDVSSIRLKAQVEALMLQATAATREAWSYSIGDERVSKEKLASEIRAQAEAREAEYLAAVAQRNGPTGSRASYEDYLYS
jgi:hypothetical protein